MPGGRPSKLTDELEAALCKHVRAGNYVENACALEGISKDTVYSWIRQGARAKRGRMKKFSDAIKKAMAEDENIDLSLIRKAAIEGQWQAAAWRRERKSRKRWGRHAEGEDAEDPTKESQVDRLSQLLAYLRALPPEQFVEVLKVLLPHEQGPPLEGPPATVIDTTAEHVDGPPGDGQ